MDLLAMYTPKNNAPLDALAAIATARGWSWGDRLALIRASLAWRLAGFTCAPTLTVEKLCEALPERVMQELIDPLCVSALNLPSSHASAVVFLNVMRDALFGQGTAGFNASSLLLPRIFPPCFPRPRPTGCNRTTRTPRAFTSVPASRVCKPSRLAGVCAARVWTPPSTV